MADGIELVIEARRRMITDTMAVARTLPFRMRRNVGPFVFVDTMGPVRFEPGDVFDVEPHPHIGLATITLLLEGQVLHRDSIGSVQLVRPGEVNWMTAGRGIAHSERTPPEQRDVERSMFGLQTWVALPLADEECDPSFEHRSADELPVWTDGGAQIALLVGDLDGHRSPVDVRSRLVEASVELAPGASWTAPTDHVERAVQLMRGAVDIDGRRFDAGELVVLREGAPVTVSSVGGPATIVLLGGDPLDGPRTIRWNFVSSDPARIERAAEDWRAGRFPAVPGDDGYVPLPDGWGTLG
ncbi:MAG: pirin family protein [Actinomycetota bacterium]